MIYTHSSLYRMPPNKEILDVSMHEDHREENIGHDSDRLILQLCLIILDCTGISVVELLVSIIPVKISSACIQLQELCVLRDLFNILLTYSSFINHNKYNLFNFLAL